MTWSFGQILRPSMFMELLNLSSRYNIFFLSNSNWKLCKSLGDRGDKLYCISHEWDQHHQQEDQWEAEDSEDIGASWERSSLPWDWQVNDARNLLFSEAQIWISTIQNSWRILSLNIQGSGWKRKVKKSVSNLKKIRYTTKCIIIKQGKLKINTPYGKIQNRKTTRAGALAVVGLALDPEGKKSVLIQPSSFELKKILKTLITVD